MKKVSIIISMIFIVTACFSGIEAAAQPVLQGSPSFDNFVGSPGMWVIGISVILVAAIALFIRRKRKLQPEPLRKK